MNVSVIIPVRDGEAFLAAAIRSVLNQTHRPAEIIVVDDGSDDRSAEIARDFGPPVHVIATVPRGGSAARALGAQAASGDALMFMDADDLLGPDTIEYLQAALADQPGSIACCPWSRFELHQGCWLTAPASCAPHAAADDDLQAWLKGWYHPPCAVLWSKSAYLRSGGWDPDIASNQDGDLIMRALASGIPLVRAAGGMSYYRRMPDPATSVSGRRHTRRGLDSRLRVLLRLKQQLEKSGRLAFYSRALKQALQTLAEGATDETRDIAELALRAAAELPRPARGPAVRPHCSAEPSTQISRAAPSGELRRQSHLPLVSVIIPTYNRAHCLSRTLACVLGQTYERFEVLVVDDASTDDTDAVLKRLSDPRVRYIRQPQNRGVAAARNRGLAEARGELIAFLDSDDEWRPDKLARQVGLFAQRPDRVGLVYTGVEQLHGHSERSIDRPEHHGDIFHDMLLTNVIHGGGSNVMIRRHVVDVVGDFDELLPAIEDYDYWTRVTRFFDVDFDPAPLMIYHNQQVAAESDQRRSRNFQANMAGREAFFTRYEADMRRAGIEHLFLLESARRHLHSPHGDRRAARRLLLRALRRRPFSPKLYGWLILASLKPRYQALVEPLAQAVWSRRARRQTEVLAPHTA